MSWAGRDRPLPPEMIPQRLFDRLFGSREQYWIEHKKSILDAVSDEARSLKSALGHGDQQRLEEYLTSVRSLERSVASLPPEYAQVVEQPPEGGDLKDWPRIAKLQTDLLVHALASRQTRVASYMLTKCQGLSRFPWLGYTYERHHEYTHGRVESPEGQRIMRDICRWHVEEFAYFLAKLKSMPEGDGTLLDHTCALYVHEHAEANSHKNAGLAMIAAGHAGKLKTGLHTRLTGTVGDLYLTLAEEVVVRRSAASPPAIKSFPRSSERHVDATVLARGPGLAGSTPRQLPPRRPGSGLGMAGLLHQLTRHRGKASRSVSACSDVMSMPPMKS